ncbi:MAG: 4Fe-4S dicluster domain-containing protein [Thermoleophilia bacterium]
MTEEPLDEFAGGHTRRSKCGACMAVCPTYRATGNEAMVARGRISIIETFLAGDLGMSDGVEERISTCAGGWASHLNPGRLLPAFPG